MYHSIDRVVVGQGAVERDAGAERLDRLVAGVREGGGRLEPDSGSLDAEGNVGCMVEFQRGGQIEAGATIGVAAATAAVPTCVTVTDSMPWPWLSMSSLI